MRSVKRLGCSALDCGVNLVGSGRLMSVLLRILWSRARPILFFRHRCISVPRWVKSSILLTTSSAMSSARLSPAWQRPGPVLAQCPQYDLALRQIPRESEHQRHHYCFPGSAFEASLARVLPHPYLRIQLSLPRSPQSHAHHERRHPFEPSSQQGRSLSDAPNSLRVASTPVCGHSRYKIGKSKQ